MTRPPTHLGPGAGTDERSTATAKVKRHLVRGHPGVTLRTWTDRAGRTQRRYDATFWGPDRTEHSMAFRRLGDAEAWLEEERTNARRGGWIDPIRGNETLGSFYERWKQQAIETGRPSERTLIAYDELWRLYIAPKLQDQSLNTITRADVGHVVRTAAKRSAWRAHDALKVLRAVAIGGGGCRGHREEPRDARRYAEDRAGATLGPHDGGGRLARRGRSRPLPGARAPGSLWIA